MREKKKPQLGVKAASNVRTWVQTERAAHEAWARLSLKSPRAAALMHHLVANMGHQNAVVVNQKTLAAMMSCTVRTVQRAVADLVADNWIQAINMGGAGTVNAYVVNDQVAWGEKRDMRPHVSVFSASVIAHADDQNSTTLERTKLRRIPIMVSDESQLPSGDGDDPPSQSIFPGLEPDLPYIDKETGEVLDDMALRLELERRGQQRIDNN